MLYRTKLDKIKAKYDMLSEELTSVEHKLNACRELTTVADKAQEFLMGVASSVQERIKFEFEGIINTALASVFGERYSFEVAYEVKRSRTEAKLVLKDGDVEIDPLNANGGGLIDILTFALRVGVITVSKAPRILILDEPFKFVSADLKDNAYAMMKTVSEELGIQVIAVTHDPGMIEIADRVFEVRLGSNKRSVVRREHAFG